MLRLYRRWPVTSRRSWVEGGEDVPFEPRLVFHTKEDGSYRRSPRMVSRVFGTGSSIAVFWNDYWRDAVANHRYHSSFNFGADTLRAGQSLVVSLGRSLDAQ